MNKEVLKHRAMLTAASGVAVALTLTACSGGTSGGDSSAETVYVGVVEPLSGAFADNGEQARLGIELCTDLINEDGGIASLGGAKIELVVQDVGGGQPADVANAVQNLIDSNSLSALIGAWASSYTLAAAPVVEQAGVPMVTESFSDDIVNQGFSYLFKIPASAVEMGEMGVDAVLELADSARYEITTAVVATDNTSAATLSGDGAAAQLVAAGVDVPFKEAFTPGLTEANSIALKLMSVDPQLIFVQSSLADMSLLIRALRDQGYTGPLLGAGSGAVAVVYGSTLNEAGNGLFSGAGWNWDLPGEANEEFARLFTEANPQFDFPGQEAGEDCAAIYGIAAALEAAASTDPSDVRDALAEIEITEGLGTILASGSQSYDSTGMLEDTTPVIVQWQDGKPYTVFPEELATRDAIFDF